MSEVKIDVYTASTGVQMTLSWSNERDCREAEALLKAMGAACGSRPAAGALPFYYLENERQLEALFALREKQKDR